VKAAAGQIRIRRRNVQNGKKSQILGGYALRITNAEFRVPPEFSNPATGEVRENTAAPRARPHPAGLAAHFSSKILEKYGLTG
jgi:hypothetical protein